MKKIIKFITCILSSIVLIAQPAFATIPDDDILDMFNINGIYYYNPSGSDDLCGSFGNGIITTYQDPADPR
jgi:hypothetical protein